MSGVAASRTIALSLGSNLGERLEQLGTALRALDEGILGDMRVSSVWESSAFEVADTQPPYLNLCVTGGCALAPEELLGCCQDLERRAGRPAGSHGWPRVLDIDLIFVGDELRDGPRLILPHPGLAGRRFVLAPLRELLPDWRHPASGLGLSEMLKDLKPGQKLSQYEESGTWWRAVRKVK